MEDWRLMQRGWGWRRVGGRGWDFIPRWLVAGDDKTRGRWRWRRSQRHWKCKRCWRRWRRRTSRRLPNFLQRRDKECTVKTEAGGIVLPLSHRPHHGRWRLVPEFIQSFLLVVSLGCEGPVRTSAERMKASHKECRGHYIRSD